MGTPFSKPETRRTGEIRPRSEVLESLQTVSGAAVSIIQTMAKDGQNPKGVTRKRPGESKSDSGSDIPTKQHRSSPTETQGPEKERYERKEIAEKAFLQTGLKKSKPIPEPRETREDVQKQFTMAEKVKEKLFIEERLVKMYAQLKDLLSRDRALAIVADIFQGSNAVMTADDFDKIVRCPNQRDTVDALLQFVLSNTKTAMSIFRTSLANHAPVLSQCLNTTVEGRELYGYHMPSFLKGAARWDISKKDETMIRRDLSEFNLYDRVIDHLLSSFCITLDEHTTLRGAGKEDQEKGTKSLIEIMKNSPTITHQHFNDILTSLRIGPDANEAVRQPGCSSNALAITLQTGSAHIETKLRKYLESKDGRQYVQKVLSYGAGDIEVVDVQVGSVVVLIKAHNDRSYHQFQAMCSDGSIGPFIRDILTEIGRMNNVALGSNPVVTRVTRREDGGNDSTLIAGTFEISDDAEPQFNVLTRDVYFVEPRRPYLQEVGRIQYCPENILGRGRRSRSIVYKGQIGSEGQLVAIKRMPKEQEAHNAPQEARLHTKIQEIEHPNIVKYICMEERDSYVYITMELCDGTLEEYLKTKANTLEEESVLLPMLHQICKGVHCLHAAGIVHRGLKPSRILFRNPSQSQAQSEICVKLAGFSSARIAGSGRHPITLHFTVDEWTASEILHTVTSLGPESRTRYVSTKSDLFSLGCVLYYIASKGHHPFQQAMVTNGTKPSLKDILPGQYRTELGGLIGALLNTDPQQRPDTDRIITHPAFWTTKKVVDFLLASNAKVQNAAVCVEKIGIFPPHSWTTTLTPYILRVIVPTPQPGKKRKRYLTTYDETKAKDLLRAIRNMHAHRRQLSPYVLHEFKAENGQVNYWKSRFPLLVLKLHKYMKQFGREEEFSEFYEV